jgi:circadian clock protein KaiC
VITGERGDGSLTRQGLEEYVSDCVILLDHRVTEQTSTRRLRIVKYRGTTHGTNEYPFLIDADGFLGPAAQRLQLDHAVSEERVSSGVPALDTMLDGKGYYRGSSVLSAAQPARARPAWRRTSRRSRRAAASAAFTSRSRSRRSS